VTTVGLRQPEPFVDVPLLPPLMLFIIGVLGLTPLELYLLPLPSMSYLVRVIYLFALKGRYMLSFALSGEWCSVLPLVFAQALVP
jgi:hypothetical protein